MAGAEASSCSISFKVFIKQAAAGASIENMQGPDYETLCESGAPDVLLGYSQ